MYTTHVVYLSVRTEFVAFQTKVISLHICSMWETICDAQAGFWLNSKFLSKFSRAPLSGISDQSTPPPPQKKTSDFSWPKFRSEYPPSPQMKTSDLSWPKFRSEYPLLPKWRLQIWVDQSSDQSPPSPPQMKTSDLSWPKFRSEYPPHKMKTSDLSWPKFRNRVPLPPQPFAGWSFRMWRLIFIIRIIF